MAAQPSPLSRAISRHSLGWLVAGNAVGLLLAAALVWPDFGDALAPLTYGRWMPLHLNWQLYGWCAVPLVGVLLAWTLDARHPHATAHARLALGAWSLALALGGVAWLGGETSGKLFLDWSGWARPLLPLAMVVLWTVLAAHTWWRRGRAPRGETLARTAALAALVAVPAVLHWSAGAEVYPSVNPDSGGATGASLLGSTLGIVAIFAALPLMLRVPRREGAGRGVWFWPAFAASCAAFGVIDHGHASHHALGQIVGLGVLIAWVPLAWIYFRGFAWDASVRPWLAAAFAWWLLLVVTGWVTFLPGVSEALKFTNGLVAHAHLAMAGLVTAMNFVILRTLAPAEEPRGNFALWQGACAVHVGVLLAAGALEAADAGGLFLSAGWSQAAYAARLAAGVAMLVASLRWIGRVRA